MSRRWASRPTTDNLDDRFELPSRHAAPENPDIDERAERVAHIKSQQKRNRTNERARLRNKSVKSSLRTAVRTFQEATEAGEKDKAAGLLVSASRKLDKAAGKGVIHKNQAANKKSALARAFNKL